MLELKKTAKLGIVFFAIYLPISLGRYYWKTGAVEGVFSNSLIDELLFLFAVLIITSLLVHFVSLIRK